MSDPTLKILLAKTYKIKVIQYSKYKPRVQWSSLIFQPIPWMPGKTTLSLGAKNSSTATSTSATDWNVYHEGIGP
jgi:hypothetical protein